MIFRKHILSASLISNITAFFLLANFCLAHIAGAQEIVSADLLSPRISLASLSSDFFSLPYDIEFTYKGNRQAQTHRVIYKYNRQEIVINAEKIGQAVKECISQPEILSQIEQAAIYQLFTEKINIAKPTKSKKIHAELSDLIDAGPNGQVYKLVVYIPGRAESSMAVIVDLQAVDSNHLERVASSAMYQEANKLTKLSDIADKIADKRVQVIRPIASGVGKIEIPLLSASGKNHKKKNILLPIQIQPWINIKDAWAPMIYDWEEGEYFPRQSGFHEQIQDAVYLLSRLFLSSNKKIIPDISTTIGHLVHDKENKLILIGTNFNDLKAMKYKDEKIEFLYDILFRSAMVWDEMYDDKSGWYWVDMLFSNNDTLSGYDIRTQDLLKGLHEALIVHHKGNKGQAATEIQQWLDDFEAEYNFTSSKETEGRRSRINKIIKQQIDIFRIKLKANTEISKSQQRYISNSNEQIILQGV